MGRRRGWRTCRPAITRVRCPCTGRRRRPSRTYPHRSRKAGVRCCTTASPGISTSRRTPHAASPSRWRKAACSGWKPSAACTRAAPSAPISCPNCRPPRPTARARTCFCRAGCAPAPTTWTLRRSSPSGTPAWSPGRRRLAAFRRYSPAASCAPRSPPGPACSCPWTSRRRAPTGWSCWAWAAYSKRGWRMPTAGRWQ